MEIPGSCAAARTLWAAATLPALAFARASNRRCANGEWLAATTAEPREAPRPSLLSVIGRTPQASPAPTFRTLGDIASQRKYLDHTDGAGKCGRTRGLGLLGSKCRTRRKEPSHENDETSGVGGGAALRPWPCSDRDFDDVRGGRSKHPGRGGDEHWLHPVASQKRIDGSSSVLRSHIGGRTDGDPHPGQS